MGCSAAIPCSARGLPRSVGAAQDRVQSGLHPEIAMRGQEFVHRNPASFIIVIVVNDDDPAGRSEEHTSELQSLMRISYAVFCLKKKKKKISIIQHERIN